MTAGEIIAALERKFGAKIKAKNAEAIDPFIVVDASDLDEVCWFLQEDHRLNFDLLHCISGVDYLEPDAKKAPKAGFDPHLEVVYHLSSFTHKHRLVVKVLLPRWKGEGDKAGGFGGGEAEHPQQSLGELVEKVELFRFGDRHRSKS